MMNYGKPATLLIYSKKNCWGVFATFFFTCSILLSCTESREDFPNLIVNDIKIGKGKEVGRFSTIYVWYTGTHQDGRVFEKISRSSKPKKYSMRSKTLIKGWRLGLLGMKAGGSRKLLIPPELAFGKGGKLGKFAANETIQFIVDLDEVD